MPSMEADLAEQAYFARWGIGTGICKLVGRENRSEWMTQSPGKEKWKCLWLKRDGESVVILADGKCDLWVPMVSKTRKGMSYGTAAVTQSRNSIIGTANHLAAWVSWMTAAGLWCTHCVRLWWGCPLHLSPQKVYIERGKKVLKNGHYFPEYYFFI